MKTVDINVRKAKPSDADALAVLFRESWEQAYRGIIPHLHLQRMIQQRSAGWWAKTITRGDRTLVLELAGQMGGYVTFGRSRWPLPYEGEIYELIWYTVQGTTVWGATARIVRQLVDLSLLQEIE